MKKVIVYLFIAGLFIACSSNDDSQNKIASSAKKSSMKERLAAKFGLTLFELENGIGPVKEKLNLGSIDQAKVKEGEAIFNQKCTQCHKLDERYTGPALREVTKRRTPEYILNQIMNPEEMTKRHPEAKKLLAQYANQMTFQNITLDDAKKVLEFLRDAGNK